MIPNIGRWATGIGSIVLLFYLLHIYLAHRAQKGSRGENRATKNAGMEGIKKYHDRLDAGLHQARKEGISEEEGERKRARAGRKRVGRAERDAERGAIKAAKTARENEQAAEVLEGITGRATGLIAEVKIAEEHIMSYCQEQGKEEQEEIATMQDLKRLADTLGMLTNGRDIDHFGLEEMESFVRNLLDFMLKEMSIEHEKHHSQQELYAALIRIVKELKETTHDARAEEGIFKRYERKEWKDFRASVNELRRALAEKTKLLSSAEKGANPEIKTKLERAIEIHKQQLKTAEDIQKHMKHAFAMITTGAKHLSTLLKEITKDDRDIDRHFDAIHRAIDHMGEFFTSMEHTLTDLRDANESLLGQETIHDAFLIISGRYGNFMQDLDKAHRENKEHDTMIKEIVLEALTMARLVESFEAVLQGISVAEQSLEQGIQALDKIFEGATDNPEFRLSEEHVERTLNKLRMLEESGRKRDAYLQRLCDVITKRMNYLTGLLDRMIVEDERIGEISRNAATYLGNLMGMIEKKKIALGLQTNKQAADYAALLERRNKAASNAFARSYR